MSLKTTALALFTCSLLVAGCGEEKKTKAEVVRPVKVYQVIAPEGGSQRSFPGKVEASEKADLSFRVSGKIIEFPVKEGDQVKEGQLIAKLDPKDYQLAVDETKSKYEYQKGQLDRYAELLKEKFVAQSKYDAQKSATDVAKTNLDAAEKNLEYTNLKAPFDGEIASRYVENFQTVKEKEPIVRLHNRDQIDVSLQIPESVMIRHGKNTDLTLEAEFDSAPGKRYPATVKEVSSQADPSTQAYKVTVTLPAPKGLNIFPGMTTTIFVNFKLTEKGAKGAIVIPTTAVFADAQGNSNVWQVDPATGIIKSIPIKFDKLEGETVSVTEGLAPGETIVAAGVKFLREGMKVRPVDKIGD